MIVQNGYRLGYQLNMQEKRDRYYGDGFYLNIDCEIINSNSILPSDISKPGYFPVLKKYHAYWIIQVYKNKWWNYNLKEGKRTRSFKKTKKYEDEEPDLEEVKKQTTKYDNVRIVRKERLLLN